MKTEFIEQLSHIIIDSVNSKSHRTNAKLVGFAIDCAWSDRVSNSHNAPFGERTNFTRDPKLPTGYPGWTGRVWVRYDHAERNGFGSDPLRGTGLHTGTGGFGSYDGLWKQLHSMIHNSRSRFWPDVNAYSKVEPQIYSWDCRIFAQDFPELYDVYAQRKMFCLLKGLPTDQRMSYVWEDPATKKSDLKIMQMIKDAVASDTLQVELHKTRFSYALD